MALVLSHDVNVVGWRERDMILADEPNNEVWLIKTDTTEMHARVWFKKDSQEFRQLCDTHSLTPADVDSVIANTSCVQGKPLGRSSVTLTTCGGQRRPPVLWLFIHDATPNGGLQPGGYGRFKMDAFHFQPLFQKHVSSSVANVRNHSAFITLTGNYKTALKSCARHEIQGRVGIKIMGIRTTGGGWNHEVQRLWSVGETCDKLLVKSRACGRDEFLLEDSVPKEAIITTIPWDDIRDDDRSLMDKIVRQRESNAKSNAKSRAKCKPKSDRQRERDRLRSRNFRGPYVTFQHGKSFQSIQPANQPGGQPDQA